MGLERTKFCEQRKDQPKKIKNRHLLEDQRQIYYSQVAIHDFMGHKTLNGGHYKLPFVVTLPQDVAPSLEVSPVE